MEGFRVIDCSDIVLEKVDSTRVGVKCNSGGVKGYKDLRAGKVYVRGVQEIVKVTNYVDLISARPASVTKSGATV